VPERTRGEIRVKPLTESFSKVVTFDGPLQSWDEPLSNLDAGMRTELRMEIGSLVRALGVITSHVTHERVEALTPLRS
jgi:ABC-type sugar transport system ATPase subunit